MSNQAVPPPPPPGAAPPPSYNPNPASEAGSGAAKGGLPTWAKVGIGCGCLAAIVIIAGFLLLGWGAKKIADVASDPATAAEMIVRAHPDLELVDSDKDAGSITIRNKSTNETGTFNYSDIANGNFTFEGSDGQKVEIGGDSGGVRVTDTDGKETNYKVDQEADGEGLKITSSDGSEVRFGAGATDVPAWVPQHPSADFSEGGGMSSVSGTTAQGTVSGTFHGTLEELEQWYQKKLEADGFTVERSSIEMGGRRQIMLNGKKSGIDTMAVTLSDDGDDRTIGLIYAGPVE